MSVLLGKHSNVPSPLVSTEIAYRTWVDDDRGSSIGQGSLDGIVRGEVGLVLWNPAWWPGLRSLSGRGAVTTVRSALAFGATVPVRRHAVRGDETPCSDHLAAPAAVGTTDVGSMLLFLCISCGCSKAHVLSPHIFPAGSMKHVTAWKSAHELMVLKVRLTYGALVVVSFVPNEVVGPEACLGA